MKPVLFMMFCLGIVLSGVATLPKLVVPPEEEKLYMRGAWKFFATGLTLLTPFTTCMSLTKNGILWKLVFVATLVLELIAIFKLANDTKEK